MAMHKGFTGRIEENGPASVKKPYEVKLYNPPKSFDRNPFMKTNSTDKTLADYIKRIEGN